MEKLENKNEENVSTVEVVDTEQPQVITELKDGERHIGSIIRLITSNKEKLDAIIKDIDENKEQVKTMHDYYNIYLQNSISNSNEICIDIVSNEPCTEEYHIPRIDSIVSESKRILSMFKSDDVITYTDEEIMEYGNKYIESFNKKESNNKSDKIEEIDKCVVSEDDTDKGLSEKISEDMKDIKNNIPIRHKVNSEDILRGNTAPVCIWLDESPIKECDTKSNLISELPVTEKDNIVETTVEYVGVSLSLANNIKYLESVKSEIEQETDVLYDDYIAYMCSDAYDEDIIVGIDKLKEKLAVADTELAAKISKDIQDREDVYTYEFFLRRIRNNSSEVFSLYNTIGNNASQNIIIDKLKKGGVVEKLGLPSPKILNDLSGIESKIFGADTKFSGLIQLSITRQLSYIKKNSVTGTYEHSDLIKYKVFIIRLHALLTDKLNGKCKDTLTNAIKEYVSYFQ